MSRCNLSNLLRDLNDVSINFLFTNIRNSNCNLCKLVYGQVERGASLTEAIRAVYIQNDYILGYIIKIVCVGNDIHSLRTIGEYVILYYHMRAKILRSIAYSLVILSILLLIMLGLYLVLNMTVSIYAVLLLISLPCIYIYIIISEIIKQLKHIIMLQTTGMFLSNKMSLLQFENIYSEIYNQILDLSDTYDIYSLSEKICGTRILSFDHIALIVSAKINILHTYIDSLPSGAFNIVVVISMVCMINILYNTYIHVLSDII